MRVGIIKTDGGPHPADKWALITTAQIMEALFGTDTAFNVKTRKFEMGLLELLEPHHEKVQVAERGQLAKEGMKRLSATLNPSEHLPEVVEAIVDLAATIGAIQIDDKDNPGQQKTVDVGAHFAKPDVQQQIGLLVGRNFATSMDIERAWHADKNANDPEAKAYQAARRERGAVVVPDSIHHYRDK